MGIPIIKVSLLSILGIPSFIVAKAGKVFTISFISILIFCGCVQSKESEYDDGLQTKTIESYVEEENNQKYVETNNTGEDIEPANILAKPLEFPTNTNAVDISFYGDEYIELLSSSLCKTDGRNIYFHTELGFYAMPVGTDELNPIYIEIPEEMDIF
ncbi:MAG: hypothetical protein LBC96_08610 [Lachnospiraceae bacterium]|jgi:hypothetical protein|nr:hypothetical protein [Lachnospiraceae bacterium]